MDTSRIRIYGEKVPNDALKDSGGQVQIDATYLIGAATRGPAASIDIELKDSQLIEFTFEDDTVWMSSSENLHELFPQVNVQRGTSVVELPLVLQMDEGQNRGIVKNIALKIIKVFTKKLVNPVVHKLAEDLENKQLGGHIGLCVLKDGFQLSGDVVKPSARPYLLFIHGTASSTAGSFSGLEKDAQGGTTEVWRYLRSVYGAGNIIAFNHRTLTESPLQNVKLLMSQLPKGAALHLVSHSRGGIVGDVLSRFCISDIGYKGFSAKERQYLAKNDRQADIDLIDEISTIALSKNITVEKFIRVACPASGTTLASKRLDHLFNIIFNLLGLATAQAANPVFIAFRNLLAAVVESKDDPDVLPGLEVQSPDSPFMAMMNNAEPAAEITAPLLVISGNSRFSLKWKGLLVITTKLFFMGKNDFVVDTRSMYNGARRANGMVRYYFDESPQTDHFNYFVNDSTRKALLLAFQNTGRTDIPGFSKMSQVPTKKEIRNAVLGLETGEEFRDHVSGNRPIAVLLPGIMGSNLIVKGDRVWINYLRFFSGGLMRLTFNDDNNRNITARSLIETSYAKLADFLQDEKYDVVTFPFDWRHSLADCAEQLNDKLVSLMKFGQPIKLIGHSMGGVLLRDFILGHKDTWEKLNQTTGFRLLFLGAPLGGSYRIPNVMFGEDDIIRTLARADLTHTRKELLQVFNSMPGLLCLLPLTTEKHDDFADIETWKNMRKFFSDRKWPLPSVESLEAFRKYRDNILAKRDNIDYSNAIYIAGQSRPDHQTPSKYTTDTGKLLFWSTKEGDESVTWESGIPQKMISDGKVYYSTVSHGQLANDRSLFRAIAEILATGATGLLKKTRPVLRGAETEFVARPSFNFDMSEEGITNTLLGLDTQEVDISKPMPVSVSVCHGDLKYARHFVLAGHFFKDGIFSAEKAVDKSMGGELTRRRDLGLYPGEIGTSDVIAADNGTRFKGAIIAGLGMQGELNPFQLTRTVEQAVIRYLASCNSRTSVTGNGHKAMGISTLAIGSGFGGLSVESSLRAILQGVQNANEKIKAAYPGGTVVDDLEFIEIFRDKALAAIYALQRIETDENSGVNIVWKSKKIKDLPGRSERIPVDNTSDWWTRITVSSTEEDGEGCSCEKPYLRFAMSTNAAREEKRNLCTRQDTVSKMLEQMSSANRWTPAIAKTIFELMIPNDFKEQVKKQDNINWIVDKSTAGIPWELLQDSVTDAMPLSVSAGMIRQLSTRDYKMNVNQVVGHTALVIGDPDLEGSFSQLPGALKEAEAVDELITSNQFVSMRLLRPAAAEVLQAVFAGSYKIMHLAGHGIFSENPDEPTGMLIGKDAFLTPCEISQMSAIPELVFVNCCYLGQADGKAERTAQNLHHMAANIGTELIDKGVKAVVVAGWAVDDQAALAFAKEFYRNMFIGCNFGEAVKKARRLIYDQYKGNNTWGAYQCYGDPFYKVTLLRDDDVAIKYNFIVVDEAEIKLTNLLHRMDTGDFSELIALRSIEAIKDSLKVAGIRASTRVMEMEALIYAGLNRYKESLDVFEKLFNSGRSDFSVRAIERYNNIRVKYYLAEYHLDNRRARELADKVTTVIDDLNFVMSRYGNSGERLNLVASAYKRKAIMLNGKQKQAALKTAAEYYHKAFEMKAGDEYYPLTNWLDIENALVLAGVKTWADVAVSKKDATHLIDELLQGAQIRGTEEETFWDIVSRANLLLCKLLIGDKAVQYDDVFGAYRETWAIAGHLGNKYAEIEHLAFLEDLLFMAGDKATKLLAVVTKLKDNLQALI